MSAAALPVLREIRRKPGYGRLRRGLPETGCSPGEVIWSHKHLRARIGASYYCLMIDVIEDSQRTETGYGTLLIPEEAESLQQTDHHVRHMLRELVRCGYLIPHPDLPWCFRVNYQIFETGPVLYDAIKRRKDAEPSAEIHTAPARAALVAETPETVDKVEPGEPVEETDMHIRPGDSEGDASAPEEMDIRPAKTYCPWNWSCPLILHDLPGSKNLISIKEVKRANKPDRSPESLRGEIGLLDEWIARKAWSLDGGPGRRLLSEEQLRDVVHEIRRCNLTVVDFVEHHWDTPIAANRTTVVGLIFSLIRALAAKPIPRESAPSNRLDRAADIASKLDLKDTSDGPKRE